MKVEDATEVVRLTVPAELECVRIVRLTASAIATRFGFDFEEVEDIRIAVDELASLLLERAGPGELQLEFHGSPESLRVTGRAPANGRTDMCVEPLTAQVLRAVIDDYELDRIDDHICFACTSRRLSF